MGRNLYIRYISIVAISSQPRLLNYHRYISWKVEAEREIGIFNIGIVAVKHVKFQCDLTTVNTYIAALRLARSHDQTH